MTHNSLHYTAITTLVLAFFSLTILPNAQAFDFAKDYSIADASSSFVAGYRKAHYDVFFSNSTIKNSTSPSYHELEGAPNNNTYYDSQTDQKFEGQNLRADYVHGYRLGWKDAQDSKYHIDCY